MSNQSLNEEIKSYLRKKKIPKMDKERLHKEIYDKTIYKKSRKFKIRFSYTFILILLALSLPVYAIVNNFINLYGKDDKVLFEFKQDDDIQVPLTIKSKISGDIYPSYTYAINKTKDNLKPGTGKVLVGKESDSYYTIEYITKEKLVTSLDELENETEGFAVLIPKTLPEGYKFASAFVEYNGYVGNDIIKDMVNEIKNKNKTYVLKDIKPIVNSIELMYVSDGDSRIRVTINDRDNMGWYKLNEKDFYEKIRVNNRDVIYYCNFHIGPYGKEIARSGFIFTDESKEKPLTYTISIDFYKTELKEEVLKMIESFE